MRAKSVFLLMLALGCGLVASIGITQVMATREAVSKSPSTEVSTIFVAMEDIPMGEPVTAQMVKLEEWPKDKVPAGSLSNIEDVESRRPKTKIYQGSPILDNLLLSKGASELGASGQIPKGFRVVSVRVDNVSGGNMIRPGDRVDVLVHLKRCPANEIAQTTTRAILQDVRVFAVNDVYDLESSDSASRIVAQTISLLVPLARAEKIILADQLGDIRLVMRSPEDDTEDLTDGAQPHELFGASESSDRDSESVLTSPPPLDVAAERNEFIDFLAAQQAETSGPVAELPSESWTMRTITGSEVNEVVLHLDEEQAVTDAGTSGFSLWKLMTSGVRRPGQSAPDATQPEPVSVDKPTEPEEADEEEKIEEEASQEKD